MVTKILTSLVTFTIVGSLFSPLAQGQPSSRIIKSQYINNGIVYWNSDWMTEEKNLMHQLNMGKVFKLYENIREDLTCNEKNHNRYEIYLCALVKSERYQNSFNNNSNKSFVDKNKMTLQASVITISSLIVGDVVLRSKYMNEWQNYLMHFDYLTPADRMILSDHEKLFSYVQTLYKREIGTNTFVKNSNYVVTSKTLDEFFIGLGLQFQMTDPMLGSDIRVIRTKDNIRKTVDLTKESFAQMINELTIHSKLVRTKYMDFVFKYKKDFFVPSESAVIRKSVLQSRLTVDDLSLFNDFDLNWNKSFKEAKNIHPKYISWQTSPNYRALAYLKRSSVIAGVGAFFIYLTYQYENQHSQDADLMNADDLPMLEKMLNKKPEIAALIAMTFDEIPQAVKDSSRVKH
jgi:hypothetical protein